MRPCRIALLLAFLALPLAAAGRIVPVSEPAWVSPRTGSVIAGDESQFYAVGRGRMTHLTPDGRILDPDGTVIDVRQWPGSAAAGLGLLVVGSADSFGNPELIGMTREGRTLWVRPGVPEGTVLFDGTAFAMISIPADADGSRKRIRVTWFDRAGQDLGSVELARNSYPYGLAATRAGHRILLAWSEVGGMLVAAVERNGVSTQPRRVGEAATFRRMAIAGNEDGAVAIWASHNEAHDVMAVRLNRDGDIIEGPRVVGRTLGPPAVGWDGVTYRVAWTSDRGDRIYGGELTPELRLRGEAVLFRGGGSPEIVAGAGSVLVANGNKGVFFDAGEPFVNDPVASPLRTERAVDALADVVWTGDRYVVAWQRGEAGVFVRFFRADGTPLGSEIPVAPRSYVRSLRIAATRDVVAVLWVPEHGTANARRFTTDGEAIDPAPLLLGDVDDIDIATDGREFLIATNSGCTVHLRSMSERGPWIDGQRTVAAVCESNYGIPRPSLAWDGTRYGLFYYQTFSDAPHDAAIPELTPYLVRVSAEGVVSAPVQLAERDEPERLGDALLAAGGGRYLAAWRGANRHSPDGALVGYGLTAVKPLEWSPFGYPSDVFWDGSAFVLLDARGYSVYDVDGKRVNGGALPTARFSRSVGAADGRGGAMIVFHQWLGPNREISLMAAMLPLPERRRSARGF